MQELKNAGFEKGMPNNWLVYSTGTDQRYAYPEKGRVSGSSIVVEFPTREIGKISMLTQDVNIDSSKKYKLSGWLRTQNIKDVGIAGGASIQVDWKDKNRNFLGTSAIMARQVTNFDWKYFEGYVTPVKGSKIATVILLLNDCSGKVWFDDISFLPSTETKKYRCTGSPDYQCVEDPNGQYETLDECLQKCIKPGARYRCTGSPDYQCVEDPNGQYETIDECLQDCIKPQPPGQYRECWDNYCGFRFKQFRLLNNKWSDQSAKQAVWYYENGPMGWNWERFNQVWQTPNYPEVIVGQHPLETSGSTTPIFPIKWSDIRNWTSTIKYEYLIQPSQQWHHNTGYDIYIIDPTKSGNASKMSNFMIWAVGRFGTVTEKVTDGINTYTYHHKSPGSGPETWHWHGFILENQTNYYPKGKLTVNIKALLDIVKQKDANAGRNWNPNWLIRGVEFGTECYAGKGKVQVSEYELELNGQKVKL